MYKFSRSIITSNIFRNFTTNICNRSMKYTESGEWIFQKNDCYKIGLSKDSIIQLGELVYLDYECEEDSSVKKDDEIVTLESVKATETINSPFDCIIKEINTNLLDPENLKIINETPECIENSWILKIIKE